MAEGEWHFHSGFTRIANSNIVDGLTEQHKETVLAWLELHDQALGASFIFEAWLNAKGDAQTLKPHIENWLKENGTSIAASRGLPIVISFDGLTEQHKENVLAWLELHDEKLEASYIIQAWAEAKGDAQTLKPHVEKWLCKYDKTVEALNVMKAWLNAYKDASIVNIHMTNALLDNAGSIAARYFYEAYRKSQGGIEEIKESMLRSFKLVDDDKATRDLLNTWLFGSNDKLPIVANFFAKLESECIDEQDRFLFQSWVASGGEIELISNYIFKWLDCNASLPEASFVYKLWVEKKLPFCEIEKYLMQWLGKNQKHVIFQKHAEYWLKNNGDPEAFGKGRNQLIHELLEEAKTTSLNLDGISRLQYVALHDHHFNDLKPYYLEWLRAYGKEKNAIFLIDVILQNRIYEPKLKNYAEQWLEVHIDTGRAGLMIKRMIETGFDTNYTNKKLSYWLCNHPFYKRASDLWCAWLKQDTEDSEIENALLGWLSEAKLKQFPDFSSVEKLYNRSSIDSS